MESQKDKLGRCIVSRHKPQVSLSLTLSIDDAELGLQNRDNLAEYCESRGGEMDANAWSASANAPCPAGSCARRRYANWEEAQSLAHLKNPVVLVPNKLSYC